VLARLGAVALFIVGPLPARADDAAGAAPAVTAGESGATAAAAAPGAAPEDAMQSVVVTARRLNEARSSIETQTGASTYTIDNTAIAAAPGGENQSMNQVLLQAPDVVQDSFGQVHVRGDHNGLQYRLNGIILPEGVSVFSQTLSPRLVSSLSLITGALPAEYGLRTAGIIDLSTNSGILEPGGSLSLYGGSYGTLQPAAELGGRKGNFSYYVEGDYKQSDLGIESPDASRDPLHNHTEQAHAFAYLEQILDPANRLSLILGLSDASYQIPNQHGLQPGLGYTVEGTVDFPSENLNENQHELTEYAILSWQHSQGNWNWQTALSARYASLNFEPDPIGDLLYNGIAQNAFKDDTAFAWQTDIAYRAGAAHTIRAGLYYQHDHAESVTTAQVLPLNAEGMQTSDVPLIIPDNGKQTQQVASLYLQDEWQAFATLTINYGVRYDHYSAYSNGSQLSPRVNFVWEPLSGTIVHGGYSLYFVPPPFELIASQTLSKFAGTSALPPGSVTLDDPPVAQRTNYYDVGIEQKLLNNALTLGIDSYYSQAQHQIDEGQFGAPIILTPFNYRYGLIGGLELTANYSVSNFSAYGNVSFQAAHGKAVESAQFNFAADDLNYIANNYIHLDHEGRVAASGGVSYLWLGTRASADFIFGTGLRSDLTLADGSSIPNGDHTPSYTQVNVGLSHEFRLSHSGPLTVRFDVINLFDKVYQIRSGSGIGVFAPQYAARRGFYGGVAWDF
jgi:outer membrane receptor protein involved in Fe transport